MNLRFEIGDKITCPCFPNNIGRVIYYKDYKVGVEFEKSIGGHSCDGVGKTGHCRWFYHKSSYRTTEYHIDKEQSITQLYHMEKQLEFSF